ncbi:hypothetical protein ACLOJK_040917 [Asimina triloba]
MQWLNPSRSNKQPTVQHLSSAATSIFKRRPSSQRPPVGQRSADRRSSQRQAIEGRKTQLQWPAANPKRTHPIAPSGYEQGSSGRMSMAMDGVAKLHQTAAARAIMANHGSKFHFKAASAPAPIDDPGKPIQDPVSGSALDQMQI